MAQNECMATKAELLKELEKARAELEAARSAAAAAPVALSVRVPKDLRDTVNRLARSRGESLQATVISALENMIAEDASNAGGH